MRRVSAADLAFLGYSQFRSRVGAEAEIKEAMIIQVLTTRVWLPQRLCLGFLDCMMIVPRRSVFIYGGLLLSICVSGLSESKGS